MREIELPFMEALEQTRKSLTEEGFGILFEIDMKKVLKEKIDVEYPDYTILGVCNPKLAHKALLAEKEVGLFLPCNVIVYEIDHKTAVSAAMPTEMMSMVDNEELGKLAVDMEKKIRRAIDNIKMEK